MSEPACYGSRAAVRALISDPRQNATVTRITSIKTSLLTLKFKGSTIETTGRCFFFGFQFLPRTNADVVLV